MGGLNGSLVAHGDDGLRGSGGGRDGASLAREGGYALQDNLLCWIVRSSVANRDTLGVKSAETKVRTTLLLRLSALHRVFFYAVQEFLSGLRVLDVLDSQVDTLFDVSVPDGLLDDNTNCAGGDVVNDTSSSAEQEGKYSLGLRCSRRRTRGSTCGACRAVGQRWL